MVKPKVLDRIALDSASSCRLGMNSSCITRIGLEAARPTRYVDRKGFRTTPQYSRS